MHTIFGYSLGGSTQKVDDITRYEEKEISIMSSTFDANIETEPTIQQTSEKEIQEK